jgi:hypothetical protein
VDGEEVVLQVLPLNNEIGNGSSVSFEVVEGFAEVLFLRLCGDLGLKHILNKWV